MTLWTRLIVFRFLRVFVVLQLGTMCIYVSTDLLFKIDYFFYHPQQLCQYYLLHLLPLTLATFPILSFLSLSFVQSQLRQKREWHLSQQIRSTTLQFLTPYVCLALSLTTLWTGGRELVYPICEPSLERYQQLIKDTSSRPILLEDDKGLHLLNWDAASGVLRRRTLNAGHIEHEEDWSWVPLDLTWQSNLPNVTGLPEYISPNWLQSQYKVSEESIPDLLWMWWNDTARIHDRLELGERLGLPLVFMLLFTLCAHWINKIHSMLWACALPVAQLMFFAFLMVQWRYSGLSHGLFLGVVITSLSFTFYVWIGHRFSRLV